MDTVLITVTGVALALAAGMGALLARMMREQRLRSDARVRLLEELAAGGASPLPSTLRPGTIDLPLRDTPPATVVAVQDLFHEEHEPSPWPRRFAVIASFAVVLALGILGWNQMRVTSAPAASIAETATAAPALELLSLRHSQEGNTLTVTGLVQNPKGGATLSNVQATLFVFGQGGTFLTSGRATLDFISLAPGDESPFVIRVPVSADVARYRVGFRGRDDRVLAHVDRRTDQLGRTF